MRKETFLSRAREAAWKSEHGSELSSILKDATLKAISLLTIWGSEIQPQGELPKLELSYIVTQEVGPSVEVYLTSESVQVNPWARIELAFEHLDEHIDFPVGRVARYEDLDHNYHRTVRGINLDEAGEVLEILTKMEEHFSTKVPQVRHIGVSKNQESIMKHLLDNPISALR